MVRIIIIFLLMASFCRLASAEEPVDEGGLAEETLALVDGTHELVSEHLHDWIDGLDRFFGDEKRYLDRANSSQLLFRYQVVQYPGGKRLWEPRLRIRLDLPRTQQRLRLMIETDSRRNSDAGQNNSLDELSDAVNDTGDEDFFSTALQLVITTGDLFDLNARAGIAFREVPDPFILLRAQAQTNFEKWNFRLSQYLYQYVGEGFGEETLFDIERRIMDRFLIRANSNVNWWASADTFEAVESLSFIASVSPRFGMSLTFMSEQSPSYSWRNKANYIFLTNRWKVYKQWAFVQLVPQLLYRPERNYRAEPSITLGLEVLFGKQVNRDSFPRRPRRMETLEGPHRSYR